MKILKVYFRVVSSNCRIDLHKRSLRRGHGQGVRRRLATHTIRVSFPGRLLRSSRTSKLVHCEALVRVNNTN